MKAILLRDVSEDVEGAACTSYGVFWRFDIRSEDVTSGATVKVQTKTADGVWVDVDSRAITEDGTVILALTMPMDAVRAIVDDYVDGTYTVTATYSF